MNPFLEFFLETVSVIFVFGFVTIERIVRFIFLGFYKYFPLPFLLDFLYSRIRLLQNAFTPQTVFQFDESPSEVRGASKKLEWQKTFADLLPKDVACETYRVDTKDGFVLVMHRLVSPPVKSLTANKTCLFIDLNENKSPVLFVHGLMMSSESFVFDAELSLALYLFYQGFDVWLGNNRGNKYSWKHHHYSRNSEKYWDFSIDELAMFDIPAFVDHIRDVTAVNQVDYVGFSCGTAQMFAALSCHNGNFRSKIRNFIALAPACKLSSLNPEESKYSLFYYLMISNRKFFFFVFGKKCWLPTADFWKKILRPKMFTRMIDLCLKILFNWDMSQNISYTTRRKFYSHLFSTTSCKVVRHWMQNLRGGNFSMYDIKEEISIPGDVHVQDYNLSVINTPVYLFHGSNDKLSDVQFLLKKLPRCDLVEYKGFSHMDFMMNQRIVKELFPRVMSKLTQGC